MIVEINFSNHKSFRGEQYLSFEALPSTVKAQNVVEIEGKMRCLKVGILYGANASGKSNLISLLRAMRDVLRGSYNWENSKGLGYIYFPFILDTESIGKKASFSIRFITKGTVYRYSTEYNVGKIFSEVLSSGFDDEEQLIYKRVVSKGSKQDTIEYGQNVAKREDISVDSDSFLLTSFLTIYNEVVTPAAVYLSNMVFDDVPASPSISLDAKSKMLADWLEKDRSNYRLLSGFLNIANTGIKGIKVDKEPDTKKTKLSFIHDVYQGEEKVGVRDLPYELESEGSMEMLFLGVRAVEALKTGMPLFVDELGHSFHTLLTQRIIEIFQDERINVNGSQLIATTHDVYQMDEKRLRKDQIWFIEKSDKGLSEVYSLADFEEVSEDTDFSKWYLAKRFGAVPRISKALKVFAL